MKSDRLLAREERAEHMPGGNQPGLVIFVRNQTLITALRRLSSKNWRLIASEVLLSVILFKPITIVMNSSCLRMRSLDEKSNFRPNLCHRTHKALVMHLMSNQQDHLCQHDLSLRNSTKRANSFTAATKEVKIQMEVSIPMTYSLWRAEPLKWGLWSEQSKSVLLWSCLECTWQTPWLLNGLNNKYPHTSRHEQ